MNRGPGEAFLRRDGCVWMVPHSRKISCELGESSALHDGEWFDRGLEILNMLASLAERDELIVQAKLGGVGDETILGIDIVELLEGAVGFVLCCLQLQVGLLRGPCLATLSLSRAVRERDRAAG
ncbi:MAG: hypothetical protein HYV07_25130 [Deltaproteobacteria bacterium]|nr:hypothetical protein [Deltaproteobacteria bacterium]